MIPEIISRQTPSSVFMASFPVRPPWLASVIWTVFAVTAMISTVMAISILLAPTMNTSGISILKCNLTNLLAKRSDHERSTLEPDATSENIVPILSGAAGSAATAVQSAVSSGLHAAATGASTVIPSAVEDALFQNMSLGFKQICLGWQNRSRVCHDLPVNLSAVMPPLLEDVWTSPVQQLQQAEEEVVSAVMGTARQSLIAGVVLLVAFAIVVVFRPRATEAWRKAILVSIGFGCLVVPFLLSTVMVYETQAQIHKILHESSFVAIENGNAAKLSLVALIFSLCMFATVTWIVAIGA